MEEGQISEEQKASFLSKVEQERKEKMEKIKDELKNVLSRFPNRFGLRSEQYSVIDNLPDDFWEDYAGNILAIEPHQKVYLDKRKKAGLYIDTDRFPNEEVPKLTDRDKKNISLGSLFESVVRADRKICDKESVLGRSLRSFMQEPEIYLGTLPGRENEYVYFRNPDIAYVNENTGKIEGIVECKTTDTLDKRALEQLQRSGFMEGIMRAIKFVKENSQFFLENGLEEIAKIGDMKITDNTELFLAIPFRAIPTGGGSKGKMLRESLINMGYPEDVKDRFRRLLFRCRVLMSCFSKQELIVLNERLYAKFKHEATINQHD